jgi:oxidoreductase
MANAREEAFRAEGHAAFVVGYTGEVGKELVKELAARSVFSRVVLVGRRPVELPTGPGYEKLEQVVVDFDKIEEHRSVFQGLDVGFCALGTTRAKSGVVSLA